LADDNAQFLEAVDRFLTTQSIEVVGKARTGREVLSRVEALAPDLVLLDLEIPDLDGLTVLRLLRSRPGSPRIIVVTLHDQEEYRAAAAQAGADGFVGKRDLTTALVPLIHQTFDPRKSARGRGSGDRA
jgi:two-component system nitrate/nitrite response regulator NarL